jgi:hypothetical protein
LFSLHSYFNGGPDGELVILSPGSQSFSMFILVYVFGSVDEVE